MKLPLADVKDWHAVLGQRMVRMRRDDAGAKGVCEMFGKPTRRRQAEERPRHVLINFN